MDLETPWPALEKQANQAVLGAARHAVVDAHAQAVPRICKLLGELLTLPAEAFDAPLISLVDQRVEVAVVQHRGGRNAGFLSDVA